MLSQHISRKTEHHEPRSNFQRPGALSGAGSHFNLSRIRPCRLAACPGRPEFTEIPVFKEVCGAHADTSAADAESLTDLPEHSGGQHQGRAAGRLGPSQEPQRVHYK
jgi:hypothetical protein